MTFVGPGANLTETVVALPGTSTVNITFVATHAVGASNLSFVQVRLGAATNTTGFITYGPAPATFEWYTNTSLFGNFSAIGSLSPSSALTGVVPFNNTTGALPIAILHANATNASSGAASIGFTVSITDPTANNIVNGLGPYIESDRAWAGWSIRFILLFSNSSQSRPLDRSYYQTEYGATLIDSAGPYSVMLLPSPYGGPSYLTENG